MLNILINFCIFSPPDYFCVAKGQYESKCVYYCPKSEDLKCYYLHDDQCLNAFARNSAFQEFEKSKELKYIVRSEAKLVQTFKLIKTPSIIISITSCSSNSAKIYPTDFIKDILFLKFDDTDDINDDNRFNESYANKILDFGEKYNDLQVICQCQAGISRSAGTAAALSNIYNGKDDFYFKTYNPNRLVYRTILNAHISRDMEKEGLNNGQLLQYV